MALFYFKFHPGALSLRTTFISGLFAVACLTVGVLLAGPMIRERLDFAITPMDR